LDAHAPVLWGAIPWLRRDSNLRIQILATAISSVTLGKNRRHRDSNRGPKTNALLP
jgi:hypothetical protein